MKVKSEFLLDTDVLLDHLYDNTSEYSHLQILMTKGLCFTTALNASQLFFQIPGKTIVTDLLNAIKVLGIHPKYSLAVDNYRDKVHSADEALFCAAAEINKLPIVTLDREKYILTSLKIIFPQEITL